MLFTSSRAKTAIFLALVSSGKAQISPDKLNGRDLAGKKGSPSGGKKGGMSLTTPAPTPEPTPEPTPTPVPATLYDQGFDVPPSFGIAANNPLSGNAALTLYYSSGWCGNNAGDAFCLFEGGGEGQLGNGVRNGDVPDSGFAFNSQTDIGASLWAYTNPAIVGPFSTDDVTTLSWVQTNSGGAADENNNAPHVALLVQPSGGGNLMWYVSQTTFWNDDESGPDGTWAPQSLNLQNELYYVVDHGATAPGDVNMPNALLNTPLTPNNSLPAGDTIVSFGFVWPNQGNNNPSGTTRSRTVRWDDVVLSSV